MGKGVSKSDVARYQKVEGQNFDMGEGGIKNGQKIPTAPYCAEFSSQIFFHAASQKPIILLASKSDCFTCLNSGINIFIYGTLDDRFRNVFKTLFCKRCTVI